jgi:hypothetical protein
MPRTGTNSAFIRSARNAPLLEKLAHGHNSQRETIGVSVRPWSTPPRRTRPRPSRAARQRRPWTGATRASSPPSPSGGGGPPSRPDAQAASRTARRTANAEGALRRELRPAAQGSRQSGGPRRHLTAAAQGTARAARRTAPGKAVRQRWQHTAAAPGTAHRARRTAPAHAGGPAWPTPDCPSRPRHAAGRAPWTPAVHGARHASPPWTPAAEEPRRGGGRGGRRRGRTLRTAAGPG